MKKRILSILLAAVMLLTLLPVTAFAASGYTITNGTAEGDKETNNGYITIDPTSAASGTDVTVTVNANEGYALKTLTVTKTGGTAPATSVSSVTDGVVAFLLGDMNNAPAYEVETIQNGTTYTMVNLFGSANPSYNDIKDLASYQNTNIVIDAADANNVTIAKQNIGWTGVLFSEVYEIEASNGKLENGVITFAAADIKFYEDGTSPYSGFGDLVITLPASDPEIIPAKQDDGTYQFTMPAYAVTVTAEFEEAAPVDEYPVIVNDTKVSSANADDVLGDTDEGATVTFTPAGTGTNAKLTLNNAKLVTFINYIGKDTLDIEVIGNNTVTAVPQYRPSAIGTWDGDDPTPGAKPENPDASLNIYGSGSLEVINNKPNVNVNHNDGIYANKNLTITDIDLTVNANNTDGTTDYNRALHAGNDIIIDGAMVNATAGVSNTLSTNAFCAGHDVIIKNGADVTAEAGNSTKVDSVAIYATNDVTISGSTTKVSVTSGQGVNSCGISAYNDVTISGGTVTATAGTANATYGASVGILASKAVTISGGKVTAKAGTGALKAAIAATDGQTSGTLTIGSTDNPATLGNAATTEPAPISESSGVVNGGAIVPVVPTEAVTAEFEISATFNFTTNLYGHKGVSSGSGDKYVGDGDIAVGEKFTEEPTQIEFTKNGSTQTRFWDASSKHELRLYSGATFVLSIAGDYKITKVEFIGSAVNLEANGVTVSDKVWEGNATKSITFVNTATVSKINSIKVTYIAVDPAAEIPTITTATMTDVYWEPITVTLACETEGATIRYTLDGSDPTTESAVYSEPLSISATTTVKAMAVKAGLDNSEVVSKTFTFGTVFASLEELVEKQPAKDDVAYVQATITDAVIDDFYVSSKGYTNSIYVTAAGTTVEIYCNDVPETWEVGGRVSGTIRAEWLLYKGTAELQKWDGGWDVFTYTPGYAITNGAPQASATDNHGYITIDKTTAASGTDVTVTVTPDEGYALDTLTVVPTEGGTAIETTQDEQNTAKYTFTMPAYAVTVTAEFKATPKYTTYENWQIKYGNGWEWSDNMTIVGDGLFKIEILWEGTGINVKSDENPIKKDWYALEELTIGEGVKAPTTVDVYLRVIDDNTLKIGVGVVPPAPAPAGITTWSALQDAIDNATASPTTIKLTQDLTVPATGGERLVISAGKNIVLDLNGHTLNRGLSEEATAVVKGNVFTVNGKLTITDNSDSKMGKITGGTSAYGAAIISNGETILESGTITRCKATSTDYDATNSQLGRGGAIYVNKNGKFTMTGGEIKGCSASVAGGAIFNAGTVNITGGKIDGCSVSGVNDGGTVKAKGGAVYNFATSHFTMTGGEISGNTLGDVEDMRGAGVYAAAGANITLGGTAKITDNTNGDNKASNLFLYDGVKFDISTNKAPETGMNVGVTTQTKPTDATPTDITTNGKANDVKYFFSDSSNCYVNFKDDTTDHLELKAPESGKKTINIPSTEGGVIYMDKQIAASGETVTLTVVPNDGYKLKSLSYVHILSDWSVIGDFGGDEWKKDIPMAETESGVFVSPVLALSAGNEFKVRKDADWDVNFGATDSQESYAVTLDTPAAVSQDGKNMTVSTTGNYVVTLDTNDNTITVTSASTSVADPVTITAGAGGAYTFTMPDYPVTVTATFEEVEQSTQPAQVMPKEVKVEGNQIKSGDNVVVITPASGTVIPAGKLNDVAAAINAVLDNEAVKGFGETELDKATKDSNDDIVAALKAEATKQSVDPNLVTDTDIDKYLNIKLVSATVDTDETVTVTAMTFDVKPMATITVTGEGGKSVTLTTEIDDYVDDEVTFLLPVDSSITAKTAAVYHENEFIGNKDINSEGKYIEVKTNSFSKFSYIVLDEKTAGAKIGDTLYASLRDAVSKVDDGQTITLLKNASDKITVSRKITFTVYDSGWTNTAKISAGKGYTVQKSGNIYTFTEGGYISSLFKQLFDWLFGETEPEQPDQPDVCCVVKTAAAVTATVVVTKIIVDRLHALKTACDTAAEATPVIKAEEMPMVAIGSIGDAVKTLQTKLNKLGYNCGEVDGVFGNDTYTAVCSFQTAKGLTADGVVGKLTWGELL